MISLVEPEGKVHSHCQAEHLVAVRSVHLDLRTRGGVPKSHRAILSPCKHVFRRPFGVTSDMDGASMVG